MHAVVMDSLEELLTGTLKPEVQRVVEAHLKTCGPCREEVAAMQEISSCFGVLETAEELVPAPGFYAQVRRRIGDQHSEPALAGFLGLDFAFGRRLVFASLITLAILGSYLVSSESD